MMAMIELAGKLGVPYTGGASGTIKGAPLQQQVDEIVRVYLDFSRSSVFTSVVNMKGALPQR